MSEETLGDDKIDQGLAKVEHAIQHPPSFMRRVKGLVMLTIIFGLPIAGIYYIISFFL